MLKMKSSSSTEEWATNWIPIILLITDPLMLLDMKKYINAYRNSG